MSKKETYKALPSIIFGVIIAIVAVFIIAFAIHENVQKDRDTRFTRYAEDTWEDIVDCAESAGSKYECTIETDEEFLEGSLSAIEKDISHIGVSAEEWQRVMTIHFTDRAKRTWATMQEWTQGPRKLAEIDHYLNRAKVSRAEIGMPKKALREALVKHHTEEAKNLWNDLGKGCRVFDFSEDFETIGLYSNRYRKKFSNTLRNNLTEKCGVFNFSRHLEKVKFHLQSAGKKLTDIGVTEQVFAEAHAKYNYACTNYHLSQAEKWWELVASGEPSVDVSFCMSNVNKHLAKVSATPDDIGVHREEFELAGG